MKLTKTTPPPTPVDWTETLEKIAQTPGQWFAVEDHGMAPTTVRPWAYKVSNGKYRTAERVAEEYGGRFEAVVHDNTLQIQFVKF